MAFKIIFGFNGLSRITDLRGSLNNFADIFHMGTFIDSTHIKL